MSRLVQILIGVVAAAAIFALLAVLALSPVRSSRVGATEVDAAGARQIAQQRLAQWLGGAAADLEVVSVDRVDFPDAALGVALPDEYVAQVITPGYRVIVRDIADGSTHEVRVSLDGVHARWAPAEVFRGRIGERNIAFQVIGEGGEVRAFMPVPGSEIVGPGSPATGALVEVRYDNSGAEPNGEAKLFIPVVTVVIEPA
jgi:hypothetical protein